jgi:hypothetical protein
MQPLRYSPHFMALDVSLLSLKHPFTFPYLEPHDPVHTILSHFFKIHFNIILPPTHRSSKLYLSLGVSHQNCVCISILIRIYHITFPSHPPFIPKYYLERSANYESPPYAVFSRFLLLTSSWAQMYP